MVNQIVVDQGGCVELAVRLARDMGPTYYYSPWQDADVSVRDVSVGKGLEDEGVIRVDRLHDPQVNPRLWIFPWLHFADLQNLLRDQEGVEVFGSFDGEELEMNRWLLKELLKKAGQPVVYSDRIVGLEELEKFLEKEDDKYVKISSFRADLETYHHEDIEDTRKEIAKWRLRFGPLSDSMEFIVEDPIPDAVEIGIDGIFAGNELLLPAMMGPEIKDALYIGKVIDQVPKAMRAPAEAVYPYLAKCGYRNFLSNEMRLHAEGVFYTDITCRMPSPPGFSMIENITNLADVISKNAKPKYEAEFACEIILHSPEVEENWLQVRFPKDIKRWVKLHNMCKVGDEYWCVPQAHGVAEFGSVIGLGSSAKKAHEAAKEVVDQVKAYRMTIDDAAFELAEEAIEQAKEYGVEM